MDWECKNAAKLTVIIMAILTILGWGYYQFFPEGQTGSKTVTVQVVAAGHPEKTLTLKTDAAYLGEALTTPKPLIVGEKGQFGLFITSVDGIAVDPAKQEWWQITKAGQPVETGVDQTPIADGETFALTLKQGY